MKDFLKNHNLSLLLTIISLGLCIILGCTIKFIWRQQDIIDDLNSQIAEQRQEITTLTVTNTVLEREIKDLKDLGIEIFKKNSIVEEESTVEESIEQEEEIEEGEEPEVKFIANKITPTLPPQGVSDKEILYRLAQVEAGYQSEEGISNVIYTVLNRVNSSMFPNTVSGVVYQPNQFASINMNTPVNSHVKEIVDKAYDTYINNPEQTHRGLYFHASGYGLDWSGSHEFLFRDEVGHSYYC